MEGKFKKIFVIFAINFIFTSHFPFLNLGLKEKEKKIIKNEIQRKEDVSEIPHTEYPSEGGRNWFISGIRETASAVSSLIDDLFHRGK